MRATCRTMAPPRKHVLPHWHVPWLNRPIFYVQEHEWHHALLHCQYFSDPGR